MDEKTQIKMKTKNKIWVRQIGGAAKKASGQLKTKKEHWTPYESYKTFD